MFDWILDPIGWIITVPLWTIFVTIPFTLLKYIAFGIEAIAIILPKLLLFGSEIVSLNNLPYMFLRMTIISVGIWFLLFIFVFFRYMFQNSESRVQSVKTAAKYSLLCWVYIVLIPIGIFALYMLIDWLLDLLGAGTADGGVADMLFGAVKPEGVSDSSWNAIKNDHFFLSLRAFKDLGGMSNLYMIDFQMLLLLAVAIGVLVAYFFAGFTTMMKIFEQVFLFCISPVIATTSVIDGGKRLIQWRDMAIGKAFVVFGIVLGSRLYISLLDFAVDNVSVITGINSTSFWVQFPNYLVIILIAGGGAFAFSEFGNVLAAFVGEGVGMRESMSQAKAFMQSGIAMMAPAKAVAKVGGNLGVAGINKVAARSSARSIARETVTGSSHFFSSTGKSIFRNSGLRTDEYKTSDKETQSQMRSNYRQFKSDIRKHEAHYKEKIEMINKDKRFTKFERQEELNKARKEFDAYVQKAKKDLDDKNAKLGGDK